MKRMKKEIHKLRCENINDNNFEDLLEEDFKDIEDFLDSYIVKKADEEKIEETISTLRKYVPRDVSEKSNISNEKLENSVISVMDLFKLNLKTINKMYWIASLLLVLVGVVITVKKDLNIYTSMSLISPIPVLLGIFEIISGRDENMWELELSYKYSLREMMLAKLSIIGVFSVLLALTLSLVVSNIYASLNLSRVVVMLLIPLFVTSSISLFVISVYREINSLALCVAIWICALWIVNTWGYELIKNLSSSMCIGILCVAFMGVIYSLKVFYKQVVNHLDYENYDI